MPVSHSTKGPFYSVFASISVASILAVALSGCGKTSASATLAATGDTLTSGTWAKQTVLASESSAMGITSNSKIERILLVTITKQGDTLTTSEQACDATSISSGGTSLVFPDAFKHMLPVRKASFKMTTDAKGTTLVGTQAVEVLGAKLTDPLKDPLPTNANDAALFDQDGDGKPGVTVKISVSALFINISGQVYLTQRTLTQETGHLESADLIRGNVIWSTDQKIIGSDSTILGAVQPSITALPDASVFTMRKISDTDTCATILSRKDKLFDAVK